jgi:hypothetical protein
MTVLAKALLALVGRHFMTLALLSAWHAMILVFSDFARGTPSHRNGFYSSATETAIEGESFRL